MRPRPHYVVGQVLMYGAFAAGVVLLIAVEQRTAYARWMVAAAVCVGGPILVRLTWWRWLPARCSQCGKLTSYREPGAWVTYLCRSCGRRERTGYIERDQ